jgi:hypothetical protein
MHEQWGNDKKTKLVNKSILTRVRMMKLLNAAHCLLNTAMINEKCMRKKENPPEHGPEVYRSFKQVVFLVLCLGDLALMIAPSFSSILYALTLSRFFLDPIIKIFESCLM